MKKLNFTVEIHAPKEKVWNALWNDASYRKWTSVFSEGSYAVSDWKEGSRIEFLSSTGEGMYSTISKMVPNEVMVFRHEGMMINGKEQPIDEETKKWSGSEEAYTLIENGGFTEVTVQLDVTEDHYDYFKEVFPKALNKLKEIAEQENMAM
jgi:uncharacterized protein YndB with AHSA1/START domain